MAEELVEWEREERLAGGKEMRTKNVRRGTIFALSKRIFTKSSPPDRFAQGSCAVCACLSFADFFRSFSFSLFPAVAPMQRSFKSNFRWPHQSVLFLACKSNNDDPPRCRARRFSLGKSGFWKDTD